MQTKMNANSLHTALATIVLVTLVSIVVGFYFTQNWFNNLATNKNQTTSKSTGSTDNKPSLSTLLVEISENQVFANKANSLFASSQNYQTQVKTDLDKYASTSGISITNYDWTQPASSGTGSVVAGVISKFVKISLGNPILMKNFLIFLQSIETNIPKMQLAGIDLSPSNNSGDSTVTVSPITIEVYTK